MRTLVTISLTAACLLLAAPVRAQLPVQVWLEGRYMQDQDKSKDHILRTGPGSGVAFGVDFSRRFGMQVALDWPKDHVDRHESGYQDRFGGLRRVETITHRAPAVSVTFAAHVLTTTRVRVTLLAGLAKVQVPIEGELVEERLGPSGEVVSRLERLGGDPENHPRGGVAFGADVPVRLFAGLSVVPSIHGVTFPLSDYGSGFVRPSIGLRWTF